MSDKTIERIMEQERIAWAKRLKSTDPINPFEANSFEIATVLLINFKRMPFDEWLVQVGNFWPRIDNAYKYKADFLRLLSGLDNQKRNLLMTDEERRTYDELPDFVTVYRGCYEHNRLGLSWSLCKETATKFPFLSRYHHANRTPILLKIERLPKTAGFLKLDRDEQELVLLFDLADCLGDGLGCIHIEEAPIEEIKGVPNHAHESQRQLASSVKAGD